MTTREDVAKAQQALRSKIWPLHDQFPYLTAEQQDEILATINTATARLAKFDLSMQAS